MMTLIVVFILQCFVYAVFCQSEAECKNCDQGKDLCTYSKIPCTTCLDGYWGGKCRNTCPEKCTACQKEPVRSGDDFSPILYHICTKCVDGKYLGDTNETKDCSLNCPTECKTCTSSRNCVECESGYFFENAQCPACSNNCADCMSKNECTLCDTGYYGQFCNKTCSKGCQDGSCDKNSGACTCKTGFGGTCDRCLETFYMYGAYCIMCSKACLDQKCNAITGYCSNGCASNNFTGLVCDSCVKGTFGNQCDMSCPNNCKGNTCEQNSGNCFNCIEYFSGKMCNKCVAGKYGPGCTQNCSLNCKNQECFQENGTCVNCNVGFIGSSCDQCSAGLYSENCSLACLSAHCFENLCNRYSGFCNELCAKGWYGENCNDSCSDGCKNRSCSRKNGTCLDGCVENYSGDKCCVQNSNCLKCSSTTICATCASGYYGTDCNLTCSENCTDGCFKSTGECNGCVKDTYDVYCNGTCSDTCRPKNNGTMCDERSGECLFGCEDGFYGETCNYKCADTCYDQTCDHESGTCLTRASANSQSTVSVVGGISGGVVIIVVVLVVVVLNKRRRHHEEADCADSGFANSDDLETSLTVSKEVAKKENSSTSRKSKHKKVASKRNEEGPKVPYELEDPNEDIPAKQDEVDYANLHVKVDHDKEKMKLKVSELYGYVQKKSREQYNKEFKCLPVGLRKPCEMARRLNNIKKNRYTSIRPYDETRVTVKDDPQFFINANYIKGYCTDKRYIASLGPTKEATEDFKTFWRMVWHEKSDVIVMLTNLQEKDKMKCEQYWPDFEKHATYGNITAECYSEEVFAEYTVRLFTISRKKEKRPLTQFHYTAWPDQGVPDLVVSLIEFWQRVKSCARLNQGLDIIHCSAGIGRTGTFIAIDILTQEGKAEDAVNVYDCILEMREQRVGMVQTPEQFVYLHKALVYTLVFECEAISSETFQEYVESSSKAVFAHHFQLLHKTIEDEKDEEKEATKRNAMYKTKNRPGADIPGDLNRPTLHFNKSSHDPDYINAAFIDSLKRKNSFIVAQTPLPSTLEDFVCLLFQEECSCVVSLEESVNRRDIGEYLPADNQSLTVGHFTLTSTRCEGKPMYMVRKLTIRYSTKPKKTKTMYHFQYTGWPKGKYNPEDPQQFLQFINDVKWMALEPRLETANL